jgi:hypothetical protein
MDSMKKLLTAVVFFVVLLPAGLQAQQTADKLDLPGDNLNLYAVLKLFQESSTLEGFEQKLNEENSGINNLDLNGDGQTDYIKVTDNVDGDAHTIVLQVDVNENEKQDVAVITVDRDPSGKTQVQLIGDEDLYGKDYIVEPNTDDNVGETPNPGYTGNEVVVDGAAIPVERTNTVAVSSWPIVQFIYVPSYNVWHSPWYWNHYPNYWHPWQPLYWHAYSGYHSNWNSWYYGHYRRWPTYRYNRWNDFYYRTRRVQSPVVITGRQNGAYRNTYSRPQTRQEGVTLFNTRNPGMRPGQGNRIPTTNPVVQPARPGIERPVTKPVPQQPVTGTDVLPARPGMQKPPTRPMMQRPVTNRDMRSTRPATEKPATRQTTRPAVQRPATRPAMQRQDTKPVQQPNRQPAMPRDKRGQH